jgi:hypothetical protein
MEQQIVSVPAPGPRMLALRSRTKLHLAWRFYADADQRWRWQRLTVEGVVVAESDAAFDDYDSCLADAKAYGHVYEPAQPKASRAGCHYYYSS